MWTGRARGGDREPRARVKFRKIVRFKLSSQLRWRVGRGIATGAFPLLFVSGVTGCAEEYDVQRDLSYDSTIGYRGTFDFYEVRSDSARVNRPAVLAIHGGAWKEGDKAWVSNSRKNSARLAMSFFRSTTDSPVGQTARREVRTRNSFESRAKTATVIAIAGRFPEQEKQSIAFWIVRFLTTATGSSRTGTTRGRRYKYPWAQTE